MKIRNGIAFILAMAAALLGAVAAAFARRRFR